MSKPLVLYGSTEPWKDQQRYDRDFASLPAGEQQRILRLKRPEDRRSTLVGRLLLDEALRLCGFGSGMMHELRYTEFGKPYFPGTDIGFNISHSGNYVVCAIARGARVGIDIEAVKQVPFTDFTDCMDAAQWSSIHNSANPTRRFFDFWTMKESLTKCHGQGLTLPLQEIAGLGRVMQLGKEAWTCYPVDVAADYVCHLATKEPSQSIDVIPYA